MPSPKEQWIQALQSGEYPQTTGHLHTKNGYCCLGVLCDIYEKQTGQGEWDGRQNSIVYSFKLPSAKLPSAAGVHFPPNEVLNWVESPQSVIEGLAGINDKGGTFAEIVEILQLPEAEQRPAIDAKTTELLRKYALAHNLPETHS